MRNTLITGIAVAGVAITAALVWQGGGDDVSRVAPRVDAATGVADRRVRKLEKALLDFQYTSGSRLQDMAAAQTDIAATLATIRTQLDALALRQAEAEAVTAERSDESPDAAEPEPEPRSEAAVSERLDASFANGKWDIQETEITRGQTNAIVAKMPGVNLADMVCNDGVCRATFTKLDGSVPDIGDVWGEPPFMNEGFTIHRDDGSVELYFAKPGVSLDDLRDGLLASE